MSGLTLVSFRLTLGRRAHTLSKSLAEKDPSKNVQELQDEARQAVKEFNQGRSDLKGPDKAGATQGASATTDSGA